MGVPHKLSEETRSILGLLSIREGVMVAESGVDGEVTEESFHLVVNVLLRFDDVGQRQPIVQIMRYHVSSEDTKLE